MRGRMVLALTVALVEQARRPWVVDGKVVGMVGPRLRLMAPDPEAGRQLTLMEAASLRGTDVPEVVIAPEDRKRPGGR